MEEDWEDREVMEKVRIGALLSSVDAGFNDALLKRNENL